MIPLLAYRPHGPMRILLYLEFWDKHGRGSRMYLATTGYLDRVFRIF
jgi:hypothetical protein